VNSISLSVLIITLLTAEEYQTTILKLQANEFLI